MSAIFKLLPSSTLLIMTLYIFGRIVLVNRRPKKTVIEILLLLGFSLLSNLVFGYTDGTVKTILTCLVYATLFFTMFDIKISKSIFTSIVYVILLVIPELIVLLTTSTLTSKEYFYENLAGSIFCNILVCFLMILLALTLRKPLRKILDYRLSENKKIVLVSILTIIFITIFFYKFSNGYEMNQNGFLYLIAMFAFAMILFVLIKQKIDNEKISKKYDELLDVMKSYEDDIEEQRTLRHETKNEFATIKCKIQDKESNDSIIKYIDSVIGDSKGSNSAKYSKFKYLPSNGLKGFFYYKFLEAEKKGIKVSVNISEQIEKSFLKDIDTRNFKNLVRIIGVYLDNAIEASSISTGKQLGIEIYLSKDKVEFIISNTFNNDVNLDKLGKESFSTKGKNRGHGLLLVSRILGENNIFESKNEVKGNIYIQRLKVKNDNKKNYDK